MWQNRFGKHGEAIMNFENDTVGGYAVPVDPMDDLQCDSCQ
jgi:hypothetical protein